MWWQTVAEAHAALNDLPAALFVASVVFDLLGSFTKRETLKAAGFWTLVAGAVGALAALWTGLAAENSIEHGEAVHRAMETHKTLGISVTILFGGLAAWRIWRRGNLRGEERATYLMVAGAGALVVIWVAHLGGNIVFRQAGGIPTSVLEASMAERSAEHAHEPGQEHDRELLETGVDAADSNVQDTVGGGGHKDPPGTPPHTHE